MFLFQVGLKQDNCSFRKLSVQGHPQSTSGLVASTFPKRTYLLIIPSHLLFPDTLLDFPSQGPCSHCPSSLECPPSLSLFVWTLRVHGSPCKGHRLLQLFPGKPGHTQPGPAHSVPLGPSCEKCQATGPSVLPGCERQEARIPAPGTGPGTQQG